MHRELRTWTEIFAFSLMHGGGVSDSIRYYIHKVPQCLFFFFIFFFYLVQMLMQRRHLYNLSN